MSPAPVRLTCPRCGAPRPLPGGGQPAPACPGCGHAVPLRDGVLQLDDLPGPTGYPAVLFHSDARLEEQHWWHASRNAVIVRALRGPVRRRGLRTGVDLGCGTGIVLPALEGLGLAMVGIDGHQEALAIARRRTAAPLLRSGRPGVPLADPVDLLALCDVLEHGEEAPLLEACRAALRPGGVLLITVPAQPWLWSTEDDVVGHRRRYTRRTLGRALRQAGLRPQLLRPFHAFVTPLALVARWRAPRGPVPPDPAAWGAARRPPSPRARTLFATLAAIEAPVGALLPLPAASHLLALAERV